MVVIRWRRNRRKAAEEILLLYVCVRVERYTHKHTCEEAKKEEWQVSNADGSGKHPLQSWCYHLTVCLDLKNGSIFHQPSCQKFLQKSLFKVESAGQKKMGSKSPLDYYQMTKKNQSRYKRRWWLGLRWFSVKAKWSTVVHSSYHCCENDSHSRQSCWCITLQSISPPPHRLHCMIDERQGKSNISQKELSRLRTWMRYDDGTYALLILQKASAWNWMLSWLRNKWWRKLVS